MAQCRQMLKRQQKTPTIVLEMGMSQHNSTNENHEGLRCDDTVQLVYAEKSSHHYIIAFIKHNLSVVISDE